MAHWKTIAATALLIAASGILQLIPTQPAWAVPRSTTPDAIEGYCNDQGGTYWPPNQNGVYGCILDGEIIVCGGALPGCDTITLGAEALPKGRFPLNGIEVTNQLQIKSQLKELKDKIDKLRSDVETWCGTSCVQLQ